MMTKYTEEELKEYVFNNSYDGEKWFYLNDYRIEDKSVIVSNYARAFSLIDGHFLKDQGANQNYMYWYISPFSGKDKPVTVPIHKAVAELFCDKPDVQERLVVDHIDGDKHNNLASNLRWVTYKENSNAQDVQKRKAESLKKTVEHRKEIETLTKLLTNKDEEIAYWKAEYSKIKAKYITLQAFTGIYEDE